MQSELQSLVADAAVGTRLPSSRRLIERHRVSPVTVSRVLRDLESAGLVEIRPGSGSFVRRPSPAPTAHGRATDWQTVALGARMVDAGAVTQMLNQAPDGTIALASGYLHTSLQPVKALAAATARAARRPGSWAAAPLAGHPELRAWFAADIGGGVTAADVLITSGGQSALSATLRALVPPGAPLLVESPTYIGALAIARAAGIEPIPVPVDAEGLRPDLLAAALAASGARVVLTMPGLHNPTGAVMGAARRTELLAVVRSAGAFLVEDDWARWLGHSARPGALPLPFRPLVADDRDGTVIHLSSLSKINAPSVRIGAVIARGPAAERIRGLRTIDDLFVTRLLQEVALELVTAPAWARHRRAIGTVLPERQRILLAALATHVPLLDVVPPPAAGFHLWAQLPAETDEMELAEQAARAGVLVSLGRRYFAAEPAGAFLRLTFSAAASTEELVEGARRLGQVVRPG